MIIKINENTVKLTPEQMAQIAAEYARYQTRAGAKVFLEQMRQQDCSGSVWEGYDFAAAEDEDSFFYILDELCDAHETLTAQGFRGDHLWEQALWQVAGLSKCRQDHRQVEYRNYIYSPVDVDSMLRYVFRNSGKGVSVNFFRDLTSRNTPEEAFCFFTADCGFKGAILCRSFDQQVNFGWTVSTEGTTQDFAAFAQAAKAYIASCCKGGICPAVVWAAK